MQWYFFFFLVSGFCSILYEIIWLRIAMAQFGVTTAMVSVVLSAFMIGLGLGCWGSGVIVRKYGDRPGFSALRSYALMELLIGVSAIAVPLELFWGRELLLKAVREMSLSSSVYYLPSGIWIGLALVPWCACMGATFPFAMAAIRRYFDGDARRSFSYLYLANILGATAGATVPLLLIELLGFRRTLYVAATLNLLLAVSAFSLSFAREKKAVLASRNEISVAAALAVSDSLSDKALLWLLFGTGLTSMGAEVVWVRLYTPFLSTVVYAFATILGLYLVGMDFGSWMYRRSKHRRSLDNQLLWVLLGVSVLLAFFYADPRMRLAAVLRVVLGIMPFSILAGFITPAILDRYSQGDPDRAGTGYAVNIVGCVIGPLLAGFLLLPLAGERLALCVLALPWFAVGLKFRPTPIWPFRNVAGSGYKAVSWIFVLGSVALVFFTKGFEEQYQPREVRRDSTATVVATGSSRAAKRLLVNGVGITSLTPITKMMVHLPMAFLPQPPQSGLVICFGMGTSHLAVLSWGVHATAVELVPSVPTLVTFFHPNASKLMDSPLSQVVIDDGRFYLERSSAQYDVITIDPPPPVEAAGSSLLYSKEFYVTTKRHLRPGGILQQWLPNGDSAVTASVTRALVESFPYVRAFGSVEGWGIHFLASASPIPSLSAAELANKLPASAARDLMEWGPASTPREQFEIVLSHEVSLAALIQKDPEVPSLKDDRPVNEYYLLRRWRDRSAQREARRRLLETK
jgi:spermidine synthase